MELQVNYIHLNIFIDCFQNLVVPQNRYLYISYIPQYISVNIYAIIYIYMCFLFFNSPKKGEKFQPSKGEEEILVATAPPEVLIFFLANAMDGLIVPRGDPSVGIHRNRSSRHSPHALVSGGVKWFFGVSFFSLKGSIQRRCNGELGLWFPKRRIQSGIEGFLSRSW